MKKSQEQKAEIKKTSGAAKQYSSDKKESINTIDVEDKIELERREAYIEPKTRDLLRKLLQDGDRRRNNSYLRSRFRICLSSNK